MEWVMMIAFFTLFSAQISLMPIKWYFLWVF